MTSPVILPSLLVLLSLASAPAQAACAGPTSHDRHVRNGAETVDRTTDLTWARCSVGQRWTGSRCEGEATLYTHEAAVELARMQPGWRLPKIQELARLVDAGCETLTLDAVTFPDMPSGWYWSSSRQDGDDDQAWNFHYALGGVATQSFRGFKGHVRLVRMGP